MEKFILILITILLLLLSGCDLVAVHVTVFQGNNAYDRGAYADATVAYLDAAGRNEYIPWLHYNLGNVYFSLGEDEAALEEWEQIHSDNRGALLSNVYYNKGVYFYENNTYEQALQMFRRSLLLNPDALDAKINLELALQKVERKSALPRETTENSAGDNRPDPEVERILEYIRRNQSEEYTAGSGPVESGVVDDW